MKIKQLKEKFIFSFVYLKDIVFLRSESYKDLIREITHNRTLYYLAKCNLFYIDCIR